MTKKIQVGCEMEVTLKDWRQVQATDSLHIGGGRHPALWGIDDEYPYRFSENPDKSAPGAGSRWLILRKAYAEVPPRVEYSLTEKGKSLFPILELMCQWGEENIDERFEMTSPRCTGE